MKQRKRQGKSSDGKDKPNEQPDKISHEDKQVEGVSDTGEKFIVPHTPSVVQQVLNPKSWSLVMLVTMSLCVLNTASVLYDVMPTWYHLGYFIFFRLAYNVGLGAILDRQSKTRFLTKWYKASMGPARKGKLSGDGHSSLLTRFVFHLASFGCLNEDGKSPEDYPAAYNAWCAYRGIVDFVLINDFWSFILLGMKFVSLPDALTFWVVLQYLVGVFLVIFNYWAKVDAHRCIGDYCWYWGDFFYVKSQDLTFDGIFQLFPHPMYTVGYSMFYGYSMILRSYDMLFVSLFAHFMQLMFLELVEEPHIQRTYGSSKPALTPEQERIMYDPKSGLFRGKSHIFFMHLDPLRSGDLALLWFALYAVFVTFMQGQFWSLVQIIIWRAFHWLGLGYCLFSQSRRQWYTRHFTDAGRPLHEAFDHWRRIYNLSSTMNNLVFVAHCIGELPKTYPTWSALLATRSLAFCLLGVVLLLLALWMAKSTYAVIGDFGWYYGDFFIPTQLFEQRVVYTGIYRFLNNPESVIGYAGHYGLALITQNWTVFLIALGSQACNVIFTHVVEVPHMNSIYARRVRKSAPITAKIGSKLREVLPDEIRQKETVLKEKARSIKTKAMTEIYELYKTLADVRKQKHGFAPDESETDFGEDSDSSAEARATKDGCVSLAAPKHAKLGAPLTVKFTSNANHSDTDWIGLYDIEVKSAPGNSQGKWKYVPPVESGEVTFQYPYLPELTGVYELRYHRGGSYRVIATLPIQFHD